MIGSGSNERTKVMGYRNEWLLLETEDEMDEIEHRPPTEEFLFYQAVTNGNMDAVRKIVSRKDFWTVKGWVCCPRILLPT